MSLILKSFNIKIIISGGALGADSLAERFALENKIEKKIHLPDYKRYGKQAPLIRNRWIVRDSDVIIAFWDGYSAGTRHTIAYAKKSNKKVIIVIVDYKKLI